MGEWIVFRERKDNAKAFFWNMYTEEKSWDAPAILQELGVAEVLQMLGLINGLRIVCNLSLLL